MIALSKRLASALAAVWLCLATPACADPAANFALLPLIQASATTSQDGDGQWQIAFATGSTPTPIDLTGITFALQWHPAQGGTPNTVVVSLSAGQYLTNGGTTGILSLAIPRDKLRVLPTGTYAASLVATLGGATSSLGVVTITHAALGPSYLQSLTATPRNAASATTIGYVPGPPGPIGPVGPAGATGPSGPMGAVGAQGATGSQGATGPQGTTGATGATGAAGTNGTSGNTLLNGSGAPSNAAGNNGDFYVDPTAQLIYGPKASGAWPTGVSYKGATGTTGAVGSTGTTGPSGAAGTNGTNGTNGAAGAAGTNGAAWYSGSGAPGTVAGAVNGDWYLNTANGDLYRMASGAWSLQMNLTATSGTVHYDTSQSLTSTQRDQARTNIGGAVSSSPSSSATLATADVERPLYPTGSSTITMANGGAGWRTGRIVNKNTATGLVTLAVPSGATLDGTTNGTTVLFPYQVAAIVQTGATAYVTDWIERAPIIGNPVSVSSVASVDLILPDGYSFFEILLGNIKPGTNGVGLVARISLDGTTFAAGASDYGRNNFESANSTATGSGGSSYVEIATPISSSAGNASGKLTVTEPPSGGYVALKGEAQFYDSGGAYANFMAGGIYGGATGRAKAARLIFTSGTGGFNGTIRGIP